MTRRRQRRRRRRCLEWCAAAAAQLRFLLELDPPLQVLAEPQLAMLMLLEAVSVVPSFASGGGGGDDD